MPPKKQATAANTLPVCYQQLVAQGTIKDDAAQRQVLAALERLSAQLAKPKRGVFSKKPAIAGLYIWGNVGRGKSMLMDLFYQQSPVKTKRRAHFHAFMQEVHGRIHQLRQEGLGDPVMLLAKEIASETTLLCFDELQATDVADASLLFRLFTGLFEAGVTVVSTSNHPPASLYTGGVQRERFGQFIALIEKHMQIAPLSSPADYRLIQQKKLAAGVFFTFGRGGGGVSGGCARPAWREAGTQTGYAERARAHYVFYPLPPRYGSFYLCPSMRGSPGACRLSGDCQAVENRDSDRHTEIVRRKNATRPSALSRSLTRSMRIK